DRLAALLGKKLPVGNVSLAQYSDLASVSADAQAAVTRMLRADILEGKSGKLVDPQGSLTRYEAATILHRFLKATAAK
ncbi:MAG: hypothetical protein RR216_07515, partial [Pseudoflavonifractor sp.]